ncbi:MAG: BMP family ABC transporter substrate-binding protein [Candidatus Verstraetearchaeota archaeon]|nr:BMP family ABC transporter substrate-binding protein [Candidatus Verstraetearchaeota archaeon]
MKTSVIVGIVIVAVIVVGAAYAYTTMTAPAAPAFKVAAIYVTPLEETWNQVLHQALLEARDELGITYNYSERVSESQVESIMLQYINSGFNMIITHSWGFWETADRIAPQFPNVYFAQGSGLCTNFGNNLALFDYYIQEAAYEAGAIAAKMTNTSKVGIVTAFSGVGDVNNLLNGFVAGAKHVNPNLNVTISYINSWYDPPAARTAASALIASGVDVIYSERYGIFEACKDTSGKVLALAFGNIVDQNNLAPDVVVGSVVWDLYPMVRSMIQGALSDNFASGHYYTTMDTGGSKFVWNTAFQNNYPLVYSYSQTLQQQIINGTIYWNTSVTLINGTVVDGSNVPISVPNFRNP